jgi:hypothetical protein
MPHHWWWQHFNINKLFSCLCCVFCRERRTRRLEDWDLGLLLFSFCNLSLFLFIWKIVNNWTMLFILKFKLFIHLELLNVFTFTYYLFMFQFKFLFEFLSFIFEFEFKLFPPRTHEFRKVMSKFVAPTLMTNSIPPM